ncbi:MAG: glycoside hydrolase family 5 protein [Reichenbachiella sp.]
MKNVFFIFLLAISLQSWAQTPIEINGPLQVSGNKLLNKNKEIVQLRGMSFFWSQWQGQYYNSNMVRWLANEWKCNIVRASIGIDHGGYAENPDLEMKKLERIIDAAIVEGIYVIVDFHSHKASQYPELAHTLFESVAKKYGKYPNIIYEIYNEPLDEDWKTVLYPYSTEVISTIRKYDKDNLIVCGTRTWSQRVDEVIEKPINDPNIAYALHFYAGTHKASLRETAELALDNDLCLFVTEFGTMNATGDGKIDYEETKNWMEWMDQNQISWCNWAVSEKKESASILGPKTDPNTLPQESDLTKSGIYLQNILLNRNYNKPK